MHIHINSFRAVYCSGLLIPNQATVAALGLLFEKVYLPNNIEFVIEFATKYRVNSKTDRHKSIQIESQSPDVAHPLEHLTPEQQDTAYKYIDWCMQCALQNQSLFGEVIESEAFGGEGPLHARLIEVGGPGELNKYAVSRTPMTLVGEDADTLSKLISSGYVPVVGNLQSSQLQPGTTKRTAKELAALLAIKSVEMLFPATRSVPAEIILEAREKLRDQLPMFWSAMFKLSVELKKAIDECKTPDEISVVGTELVDTIVRPALTDLNHKIELERKQWFRRVFGSVFKALKVAAANPPLTPEQLIRSSLMMGADAAMNFSDHLHKVEAMKAQAGLTYLLDLSALVDKT